MDECGGAFPITLYRGAGEKMVVSIGGDVRVRGAEVSMSSVDLMDGLVSITVNLFGPKIGIGIYLRERAWWEELRTRICPVRASDPFSDTEHVSPDSPISYTA